MPITINGSGTVTGISAGGLPDGIVTTAEVADANITAAKLNGAQTGTAPIYGCRAWVNFDGTRNEADTGASTNGANVKIRASGNVTSVLKNAVGIYTVTFVTAMPDANYAYVGFARGNGIAQNILVDYHTAPTTAALPLRVVGSGTVYDSDIVNITIFR
jgi:hypothetical protein